MRLALSDDEAAFRDELRDFFTTQIPADIRQRMRDYRAAGVTTFALNPSPPGTYFPLFQGQFPEGAEIPPFSFPDYLRVIGEPLAATPLAGLDALLSIVQMPPGIPVATVAVGEMGARNAGHLAAQIVALDDADVEGALGRVRARMRESVQLPEGFDPSGAGD